MAKFPIFALFFVLTVGANAAQSVQTLRIRNSKDSALYNFKPLYEWKQIEFEFESEDQRTAAIANGTFAIGKVQPADFQQVNIKSRDGHLVTKYFVTTPRLSAKGVPATLSVITNKTINGNPVLRPYPDWSLHLNPESCSENRLVSAARLWYDECGRLWLLDHGYVGPKLVCNPQILVFDPLNDKLIFKYEIDETKHKNKAQFNTPVVEVLSKKHSCLDTWVYVTDPMRASLLVLSLKLNQSWVVRDATFEPDVKWAKFTVAEETLTLNRGLTSIAISPSHDGNKRKIFYNAFASASLSYVYTKDLRNVSLLKNGGGNIFHTYPKSRNQQSAIAAFDRNGNLHFSLLTDIKIARWNENKQYEPKNFKIVADDQKTMQFPTGLKIGNDAHNNETIWVFSTRYQNYVAGKFFPNETNFRILSAKILK